MKVDTLTRAGFDALFGARVGKVPPSIEYLWDYLRTLGADAFLLEERYVDRHFLDDFANYYSRGFRVPAAHCDRLHFFAQAASQVDVLIDAAMIGNAEDRARAESALKTAYVGFVVRRPLAVAPVGRTVLRTYPPDGGRRQYTAVRPYDVNLLGLKLRVEGLAYQQQDGGAAVCASTALWSALQRIATVAGHRTPTPWEVTDAAASPFAASYGLDDRQMATALATLGYSADYFVPAENRQLFRAKIAACLQSRLPVVLLISRDEATGSGTVRVGHAVVATGYAQEASEPIDVPAAARELSPLPMRAAAIQTLYVHDDNLGSHAHYELLDWDTEASSTGHPAIALFTGRTATTPPSWWTPRRWVIDGALVPKPPKLRMPIDNLFSLLWSFASELFPVALPGIPFHYSVRMMAGVDYLAGLFAIGLDASQMRAFQARATFPRFVGVVSAWWKDALICDFVTDVTAIDRVGDESSLLAAVAPGVADRSAAWKLLDNFCTTVRVPLITAARGHVVAP